MEITYNVYRRIGRKIESQNGSFDLEGHTPDDWPKSAVRKKIRDIIQKKHPRWIISGYGIAHESLETPVKP